MTRPLLIGLNGFKGVGKNTVGDILEHDYGFTQLAFADKLKEAVIVLFDITRQQIEEFKNDEAMTVGVFDFVLPKQQQHRYLITQSFRSFLQRFGAEMAREVFGENFWLDQLLPLNIDRTTHEVITDARFINELKRIKEFGGININVVRPNIEGENHASEIAPPKYLIDYTLNNDGSVFDLHRKVEELLRFHYVRRP